ncbi:Os01g0379250 [Oryza sativa Japonica Group]|uniref:Os01g0379250 protein n=2 Tax=Oryza sativa subsp. japonica TaxID=39947 RepID=Q5VNR2_ORYSJ|nr:hypothetical protein [Oryza sativa Japonica Group]BAS72222.1 Os01g0379250 [Oryza sativa Japonica Group]
MWGRGRPPLRPAGAFLLCPVGRARHSCPLPLPRRSSHLASARRGWRGGGDADGGDDIVDMNKKKVGKGNRPAGVLLLCPVGRTWCTYPLPLCRRSAHLASAWRGWRRDWEVDGSNDVVDGDEEEGKGKGKAPASVGRGRSSARPPGIPTPTSACWISPATSPSPPER